ncbi:MAG: ATP-binding protein [bacterium]
MTRLIPEKESLTVEFKSDRKRLADRDLVEAAVCLANTDGGDIYLGVEKMALLRACMSSIEILPGLPH